MYVLGEEPLDRRARRRDRQGDLDARERGRRRRSRHELLGERGPHRIAGCSTSTRGFLTAIDAQTGNDDRVVRRQRPVDVRVGLQSRRHQHPAAADRQSRAHLREPDHHLAAGRRRAVRRQPRRHARLRRAHRQARVGVPQRAREGRVRRRHLARSGARDRRRRPQLERAHRRRGARHRLHPVRHRALRLLRRQPQRQQPVRQQPRRARRATGKRLWHFQARAPRSVGLRPAAGAEAADRPQRRPQRRRRRAGHQARVPVRLRSRDRASRSGRSRSGRCRRPTCRASRRRRRSRSRRCRRRSRGSRSPRRTSTRICRPRNRRALREMLQERRATKGCSRRRASRASIEMPGHNGGANWGSSAVDPTKGTFYIVSKELPTLLRDRAARDTAEPDADGGGAAAGRRRRPAAGRRGADGAGAAPRSAAGAGRRRRSIPGAPAGFVAYNSPYDFLQQLRERPVGDRSAVVAAHRVRPEHRQNHLAGSGRRDAGPAWRQDRSRQLRAARRRRRRRPAACSSSAPRPIASCAPTTRTPARCCGRWTSRRAVEGVPTVYEVGGRAVRRLLRRRRTRPVRAARGVGIAARPGAGAVHGVRAAEEVASGFSPTSP